MDTRNYRSLFIITFIVALILLVLVAYLFLLKPKIQGYVIDRQIEAKDLTLLTLINQVQQQGYAQITIGNQSLILVPYDPNQQIPQ